jgi:protein AATF/BFR2
MKGLAVQNQLQIWEKLLEIRIKMQKSLTLSNSFPVDEKFNRFYEEDKSFAEKADGLSEKVSNLLSNLMEMQDTLFANYQETQQLAGLNRKRKSDSKSADAQKKIKTEGYSEILSNFHGKWKGYQNDVIQKWYDRTKVVGNMKNQKGDQNILRKIENSLLNKDELVKKTQLFRGGYQLFDAPNNEDGESESAVYSPEIFDDSDFYHQLLREFIEYKANATENPTEISNKLVELQKVRNKMKKKVDTKASKGRKIR